MVELINPLTIKVIIITIICMCNSTNVIMEIRYYTVDPSHQ